jgi:hypothetical protein
MYPQLCINLSQYDSTSVTSSQLSTPTGHQYPMPVPTPVIIPNNTLNLHPTLMNQRSAPPIVCNRVEVHQNPAFEDDEGIAESGL